MLNPLRPSIIRAQTGHWEPLNELDEYLTRRTNTFLTDGECTYECALSEEAFDLLQSLAGDSLGRLRDAIETTLENETNA